MKTLDRVKAHAYVPGGLVQQLAMLPSPEQANHHIIAAMLRPLRAEIDILGFCDLIESLMDGERSKVFIESFRNGMFCVLFICTYWTLF